MSFFRKALGGFMKRAGRRGVRMIAMLAGLATLTSSALVLVPQTPAHADTDAKYWQWWGPACSGGSGIAYGAVTVEADFNHSGNTNPSLKIVSKAGYDPGAAEAILVYTKVFGRYPTCDEIAQERGKTARWALHHILCNSTDKPTPGWAWSQVSNFCNAMWNPADPAANPPVDCATPYPNPPGVGIAFRGLGVKLSVVKINFWFFTLNVHPTFNDIVIRSGTPDAQQNSGASSIRTLDSTVAQNWASILYYVQAAYHLANTSQALQTIQTTPALSGLWTQMQASCQANMGTQRVIEGGTVYPQQIVYPPPVARVAQDKALRGLFDVLAPHTPVGTDILCAGAGLCNVNLYDVLNALFWAQPRVTNQYGEVIGGAGFTYLQAVIGGFL